MTDVLAEAVPDSEPPVGDAVDDIFRRAGAVRRRRIGALLAAGALAVVGIVAAAFALTSLLLPNAPRPAPAVRTAPPGDPVLDLIRPVLRTSGLVVIAREPARGPGWRRYRVLTSNGRSRGIVEISAYAAPDGLCFPVRGHPGVCARPELAAGAMYARYSADRDVDWQVNEVIARFADGRVIVVQATGERGTGTATGGRPPLSALVAARIATDPRVAAGFAERNDRCPAACPVLMVPVRPAGG